jgi:hypothetical protein
MAGLLAASGLHSATHAAARETLSGSSIRIDLPKSFAEALPREHVR